MVKNRLILMSVLGLATLSLSACAQPSGPVNGQNGEFSQSSESSPEFSGMPDTLQVFTMQLRDDVLVDCVTGSTYDNQIPPECDWNNKRVWDHSSSFLTSNALEVIYVESAGREVACVHSPYKSGRYTHQGGIDCDWVGNPPKQR